jgi:hypothetical protein
VAVSDEKVQAVVQEAPIPAGAWMVPAYIAGLVLVFLGERVIPTIDWVRYALSGLGVAIIALVTGLRVVTALRAEGERRGVERTLAVLSGLGLLALLAYFSTTETGRGVLGVAKAAPETRARIEGATTVGWLALLAIAAVPLFFGELALAPMRRAPRIEGRRVRAATISGLTLALAAVYSALLVYATGELDKKVDFSFFRTARPSESTKRIAEGLTEPIKVTAFFPQINDVGAEVEGYLREVAGATANVTVEVQDRLLVPALAKEAKVTQDGVIVLTRGTLRESLTVGTEMKTAGSKLKSLDADFQKALLKVVREQRTAYLTVGHGELNEASGEAAKEGRSAKSLRKVLEFQNYTVKDLGLAQGLGTDIPKDAYVVLMLGPSQAPLPEVVAALRRYVEGGGHLLLALDPDARVDLDPLAGAVGLTWKKDPLANDKVYVRRRYNPSDQGILVTNRYSSHASVSTLSRVAQRAPAVFPGVSSLDKAEGSDLEGAAKADSRPTFKIDFAVKSLAETFVDLDGNFTFDGASEKRNTYNVAAAVSKDLGGEGKEKKEMRAFVLADADALSDAALGHEPNYILAADALRWLGGEESFAGAITPTEDVRIEHTKQKDQLWFYGTILLAPSLVLGLGFVVMRRGKRGRGRRA